MDGARRGVVLPELVGDLSCLRLGLLDDGAALRGHRGDGFLLVAVALEGTEQAREHPSPAPLLALVLGEARRVLRAGVDVGRVRVAAGWRGCAAVAVAVHVDVAVEGGAVALVGAPAVVFAPIERRLVAPASAPAAVYVPSSPFLTLVYLMPLVLEILELALQRLDRRHPVRANPCGSCGL